MTFSKRYTRIIEWLLPSPFALAFLLTLVTGVLAYFFTNTSDDIWYAASVVGFWEQGVWDLLTFSMQMVLILILGHTLALSKPAGRIIDLTVNRCTSNTKAAVIITISAIITGYLNWGLGLVYGAVLARKVAEMGQEKNIKLNYPLLAACAYVCMMVWHGGFSGSAPLDVSGDHHKLVGQIGVVDTSMTILSRMNIITGVILLVALPALAFLLARKNNYTHVHIKPRRIKNTRTDDVSGTDLLDHSRLFGYILAALILSAAILKMAGSSSVTKFFSLNNVNLLLFGLAVLAHGSFNRFLSAVNEAVKGSAGIIIQFPLYAGIMGIMKYSGLLVLFAQGFINISDPETFPVFAMISSGIINIIVPSGGGQWQIQGPVLIEAAQHLNYSVPKTIMSLAYGDQLTNMLQPFWALPLLSITGLKAKDILPYSVIFMLAGGLIFLFGLLAL